MVDFSKICETESVVVRVCFIASFFPNFRQMQLIQILTFMEIGPLQMQSPNYISLCKKGTFQQILIILKKDQTMPGFIIVM